MNFEEIQQKAKKEWEDFNRLEKPRILIGEATCGRAAGAKSVWEQFQEELEKRKIDADIFGVGCLGMCYSEPNVEIGLPDNRRVLYHNVTTDMVPELVNNFIVNGNPHTDYALCSFGEIAIDSLPKFVELPMIEPQVRVVLRNTGIIDPTNVYHYIARDGYTGLAKTLGMSPEEVCEVVRKSGLRGRGGAGFSTGVKWGFALNSQSDLKYMICNADEGDPGAFMDRAVLESDPHAVLEGLAIGAYAIGANKAIVYARAEYPLAIERLRNAINQMKDLQLLGNNIMGSDFNLEIRIKMGAGAFVCGEETALMASIEGKRGMPRPRPPFPAQAGLNGKPTNINNVETLANVSEIMRVGADWFAGYGTEKSKGTKTFALAGKIERTGLIEVPMGITINEIIFNIGDGILDQKKFKAIQTGGPSGGSIPAEMSDLKVDYEELAKAGSIMGSGGMIVMDEDSCMVDVAKYFLEFTHNESCGKCVPCRMGSQHLLRLLTHITEGKADMSYIGKLEKLAKTVQSGSLCGLGQGSPNPVLSTLRYFRGEYEAHISQKQCAAGVCRALVASHALEDKCLPCLESVADYDTGGYEALKSVLPELVPKRLVDRLRISGCAVDLARFSMIVPVQNRSCTKCSSCRLGAAQMQNVLDDIATGNGKPEMLDLLFRLIDTMSIASECPVGKTGSDIVLFMLERFRDQFEAHISGTACPSGICNEVLAYNTICPLRAGEKD